VAADLKGLIETVARALADQPDAVIGRQGRTAAALRTLLASVAEDERRVSLDIRDPQGGR